MKQPEWMLKGTEILNVINPCSSGKTCPYGLKKQINKVGSPCAMCDAHEEAKAQAKKMVKWGDDDCTEHGHFHTAELLTEYGGSKATYPYERHECPECWQQLKKEVGL